MALCWLVEEKKQPLSIVRSDQLSSKDSISTSKNPTTANNSKVFNPSLYLPTSHRILK